MLFMHKSTKYLLYLSVVCAMVYGELFWYPVSVTMEVLGIPFTMYQKGVLGTALYECGFWGGALRYLGAILCVIVVSYVLLAVVAACMAFLQERRFFRDCDAERYIAYMETCVQNVNAVPALLLSQKQKDKIVEQMRRNSVFCGYGFALMETGCVDEGLLYLSDYANNPKESALFRGRISCVLLWYAYHLGNEADVALHKARIEELAKKCDYRETAHHVEMLSTAPSEETLQYFTGKLDGKMTNLERGYLLCTVAGLHSVMGDEATALTYMEQAKAIAPNFKTVRKLKNTVS